MNNLKQLRKNAGFTLDELGALCGKSKSHLHELEQDGANPTIATAYAIAKILGVSVYEVWTDDTEIAEETITIRRIVKKST